MVVTEIDSIAEDQAGSQHAQPPKDYSDQKSGNTKYRANKKRRRMVAVEPNISSLSWARPLTIMASSAITNIRPQV